MNSDAPSDGQATCRCTRRLPNGRVCNRPLRDPASIARGMGATCARKAAVEATFKPQQVAKAVELVELHAITRARPRSKVFLAVASDGQHTYYVGPKGCTCPHGRKAALKGEPAHCYHSAARAIQAA